MKVLFIGGTGNISTAVSKLSIEKGIELYHINRGKSPAKIKGVNSIVGDINDFDDINEKLKQHTWDVVVNWIAFAPEDIERDFKLFHKKTKQYIFISSASCYQTPLLHPVITESTPLHNSLWDYSNNKIKCEGLLAKYYREQGFPMTIVRPSHTYDTVIPIAIGGFKEFTTADRILKGKKIIVHGDGKSLWTVTHAEDFAKGFVGLMDNYHAIGHPFHITSDEILSWDNIYKILAKALGREANIVHIASDLLCSLEPSLSGTLLADKAESVIFDNSKIKSFVPGFKATIHFSEGIKRTLTWLDENPKHKIINPKTNDMIDRILKQYEKAFA